MSSVGKQGGTTVWSTVDSWLLLLTVYTLAGSLNGQLCWKSMNHWLFFDHVIGSVSADWSPYLTLVCYSKYSHVWNVLWQWLTVKKSQFLILLYVEVFSCHKPIIMSVNQQWRISSFMVKRTMLNSTTWEPSDMMHPAEELLLCSRNISRSELLNTWKNALE